jgi:Putative Actinobacterial Holin-X, holin superfamily III
MAHESLKDSRLTRTLSDVVGDLADLFQKEMRLARAEISDKIATKLQGSAWMAAAGVLGLLAALLLVQALVFGIASFFGIALHWSCLIVAGVFGAGAAAAFFGGRAQVQEELTPTRTINQIKQDIATTKEQLT